MSIHLDPLISTYIGPYLIRSLIGKGGMGRVYEAYHETLDRFVAIKLLINHEEMTESMLHKFRDEARSASKCKHPNIITIYDFGVHQKTPYMVMELLKGESLQELMKRQKTLKPIELLEIIIPIANALHVLHTQGMIHRDIKPGNIFIEQVNDILQIKLLDFGLAFFQSEGDLASHIVGTPTYMAPEQILRKPLTSHTDVFALAAVCYYCLSGQSPLESNSAPIESLLQRAMNMSQLPEIASFTSVSKEVSHVITQGMSHQAEDRPATPIEFVNLFYQAIKKSSEDLIDHSQINSGSLPNLSLLINISTQEPSIKSNMGKSTIESQELSSLIHDLDKTSQNPINISKQRSHPSPSLSSVSKSSSKPILYILLVIMILGVWLAFNFLYMNDHEIEVTEVTHSVEDVLINQDIVIDQEVDKDIGVKIDVGQILKASSSTSLDSVELIEQDPKQVVHKKDQQRTNKKSKQKGINIRAKVAKSSRAKKRVRGRNKKSRLRDNDKGLKKEEARSIPKPEPEPKPEPKPESKPKPEPEPEPKPEPKPESKPKPEPKPESKPESKTEPKPKLKSEPEPAKIKQQTNTTTTDDYVPLGF